MPQTERVQTPLSQEEIERFRSHALGAGMSLGQWMREAALKNADELDQRERLQTPQALAAFFATCDRLDGGEGDEPDWDEVKQRLADEKTRGLPRS